MRSKKDLIQFEYYGLRKVISGGQCGSDRGGIEAAKNFGIETGGTAPAGWRTWYGPAPELKEFGLTEHRSSEYPPRTESNVRQSDGTLIVASNLNSPGITLTRNLCNKFSRPFFSVRPADGFSPNDVVSFLVSHNISVLNVAGNRDKNPSITTHLDFTQKLLTQVFEIMADNKLIIKP